MRPNEGETRREYIARFMADTAMGERFPDAQTRLNACHERWGNESPRVQYRRNHKSIELRQTDNKERVLEGHAAVFNLLSDPIGFFFPFRERILPGAFARTLDDEDDVRALVDHDPARILGRTKSGSLELREDDIGLFDHIVLPDTQLARDLVISIERGDIDQQSFAFEVRAAAWFDVGAHPDFPDEPFEIRELMDVKLWDVSPVTFAAFPQTDIDVRSYQAYVPAKEPAPKRERLHRVIEATRERGL